MLALSLMTGCILPPERELSVRDTNSPPQVDLASLYPATPVSLVGPDCEDFNAGALVHDPDNDSLLFRFVSNNMESDAKAITNANAVSFAPRGMARNLNARVVPFTDFRRQFEAIRTPSPGEPRVIQTAVLSLFITDAEAWADPDPSPDEGDTDLSQIAETSDGAQNHVIEIRWAFQFDSTAPRCPQ